MKELVQLIKDDKEFFNNILQITYEKQKTATNEEISQMYTDKIAVLICIYRCLDTYLNKMSIY